MAEHRIAIDVVDISIPESNHRNIPVINEPNRCYGYQANADEVKALIQLTRYYIYESGTQNLITGKNYYDYFPEEGGGSGGGGMTPEQVQALINASIDTSINAESNNAIANSTMTNFVNSSIATATAEFRGTYTSLDDLEEVGANKNDYAFVQETDTAGNTIYKRYKYTEIEDSHPLPEGYTRIAYIKSTGEQVIDTGINISNTTTSFKLKADLTQQDSAMLMCGSHGYIPNDGTNRYFEFRVENGGTTFTIDAGFYRIYSNIDNSIPLEFEYNYPKIIFNGNVNVVDTDQIFTFTEPGTTFSIFGLHSDGGYYRKCKMKLFSFTMYDENGDPICDLIPCRNSNEEVGVV